MKKTEIEIIRANCSKVSDELNVSEKEAEGIVTKAILGREIANITQAEILDWVNNRLLPSVVMIDFDGYTEMCVDALKTATVTAATDYGSSRQRDLGQIWADMTRGYLGEYAFKLFLKKTWGMTINLGHELGELEEYLPSDIGEVLDNNDIWRPANIALSIKTTKFNGIWLDIPQNQFNHSDIHCLIKVAAGRDHLFAYLKNISVFRDKVLKSGVEKGSLTEDQARDLFDKLPDFRSIPAYVCGFVRKDSTFSDLSYGGKKGRKNYTISKWNGPIIPGDLDKVKKVESISGSVKFEGIGSFAHDKGYLFNAGNLLWTKQEWDQIVSKI